MAGNKAVILLFFMLISATAFCQKHRYMVFFRNKAGSPYTTETHPIEFLSERAITRRVQQDIPITEQDLPVDSSYLQDVRETGAEVFFATRWMNGVLIQCEESLVPVIEDLSFVTRVELVGLLPKLMAAGRKRAIRNIKSRSVENTDVQLQMIGLQEMHLDGYRGAGKIIAIFDSGFDGVDTATPFQHLIQGNKIDLRASKDFVTNSGNVFQFDDHGTNVFSVIAAWQPGTFTGGAYEADYQLYVTEEVPTEYRVEEYNWLFAAERADSAGADIIQSSLGYNDFDLNTMDYTKAALDGKTTVVSRAAQWAADRGIVVVCSAGNEGNNAWETITAPADAADVLAVANVNANLIRSPSSSKGPSSDGRIKPDVAALGTGTQVITPTGATGSASGTSLAAPLITSLVAGVWQRYPDLTNVEIIEAIRNASSQADSPDHLLGYGIPHYGALVNHLEPTAREDWFDIYPNPVYADSLVIKARNPGAVQNCQVELISSQGTSVFREQVNFNWGKATYQADLSLLSAGMYFLRISWADKKFIHRLVKI